LWSLEVANVLLVAERRKRLTRASAERFWQLVNALNIVADDAPPLECGRHAFEIGSQYGLSAYDATYLFLAIREGLPLATLDTRLRHTAAKVGVTILATAT
jgi:predicted nucleic acid-binding protein